MNLNEFFAGYSGGILGTLMSHPFDTIRINKQIYPNKPIITITKEISKNGLRNFYKGVSMPLMGMGLEKAIVFGTFYNFSKVSDNIMLNGFASGVLCTIVVTPIEKIKIDLQNNFKLKWSNYTLPILYKGLLSLILREGPAYSIYFSVYEKLKKEDDDKLTTFINGAICGVSIWTAVYPVDSVKTLIQTDVEIIYKNKPVEKTYPNVIKYIWQSRGIRWFYTGLNLALLRCIPLHGGVFLGYEIFKQYLK